MNTTPTTLAASLLLLTLSLLAGASSRAQTKELVAQPLQIGMIVPDDITVATDTKETFIARNQTLSLTIRPYTPTTPAQPNATAALQQHAETLGYKNLSNTETIELNGFQGCYAIGKTDDKQKILAILLTNTQTQRALFILIRYQPQAEQTALRIANSFYAE
jgi:hypothetical protein